MTALRLITADHLSESLSALTDVGAGDTVLMCEVQEETDYAPHHPKKIVFLFAAMRAFAAELRANGVHVRYVKLEDPGNAGSFTGEVGRAVRELRPSRIILTEPGEERVNRMAQAWQKAFGVPVEIRPDTRFMCSAAEFYRMMKGKRQYRMEFFYREMRRKHGILLEADGSPVGGKWNYDAENRAGPPPGLKGLPRPSFRPQGETLEVMDLVKRRFGQRFGDVEPFGMAVTRGQALEELTFFMEKLLPHFGRFQDVMVKGEPFLFHSCLSAYLNAGLLLPAEVCRAAEMAYHTGRAPLNAAEGFIRQVLGWREFVRGIYRYFMPEYAERNALDAHVPLPALYWGGPTSMTCMKEAVEHTRTHAYSHHIQRLMITGNFALLAGLDVKEVQTWYLAVYADAFEWVEMPNTLGMALYGDGGVMASKPYAASGHYISKMSDYCKHCRYNPKELTGEDACPFSALYRDFLERHKATLGGHPRLGLVYQQQAAMSEEKRRAVTARAADIKHKMAEGTL